MFIKINNMYFNVRHIVAVEDTPTSTEGKVRIYVWGLKTPVFTDDFVRAESLTTKLTRILRNGESS